MRNGFASKSTYIDSNPGPGLPTSVYYDYWMPSTIAFVNFQHHAEDARFVTKGKDGEGLREIYLGLNKLLRGGVDVRGVGHLNIARNVLLHSDAGARGADAADISRIDLNAAPAKEPFSPGC